MTETEREQTDEPVLAAENLTHSYGDVAVLDGVTLEIPEGRFTALIGPNGAGKTTLLRLLVGLERPDGGRIRYDGPDRPRRIGYLPQRPAFRPEFTAAETLYFYESLLGVPEPQPRAHLERVGLAAAADRPVGALSGGMRQLLGIAQAVIGDPPVVVLDEPAHGLDPGMRSRIFGAIEELAARGVAVLATTHDLNAVERSGDRIGVLDRGRVVRVGTPAALRDELGVETLTEAYDASVAGAAGTVYVEESGGEQQ
ncbi:ABC transporter ATP-binding protein [Halalkaliarchaeum desulfuricum]|uniref:ABC transporter ATP-binding protein n=1 Tax=Halalkaliarchaeum desulfuricum TaxID=2055893 RepID=A0A343TF85_9EURY|nr:ABC transporter ATP-binding protein [Halalkaliarchaeum desulfuricum]AUX07757.1 ABC transporter ATP-binding protein [Halalkaliarchaeum desulfuricum]